MQPIAALFSSRKFILALFVTAVGAGLVFAKIMPVADLQKFIGAVTLVLIGAIAHEDAAAKSAGAGTPDTPPPSPPSPPGAAS